MAATHEQHGIAGCVGGISQDGIGQQTFRGQVRGARFAERIDAVSGLVPGGGEKAGFLQQHQARIDLRGACGRAGAASGGEGLNGSQTGARLLGQHCEHRQVKVGGVRHLSFTTSLEAMSVAPFATKSEATANPMPGAAVLERHSAYPHIVRYIAGKDIS